MESLGQDYGYILYRTQVTGPLLGNLGIEDLRGYAEVYLDKRPAGAIDRRLQQTSTSISVPSGTFTLDILVENTGRINFGPHLSDGRSGIVGFVSIGDHKLTRWQMYSLPMKSPDDIRQWRKAASGNRVPGPAFHRGTFNLDKVADTYLDTSALTKGFVWVNGHNLGRTWDIGPQKSLFLPAPWLRQGENEVVVFNYADLPATSLRGVGEPIWTQ